MTTDEIDGLDWSAIARQLDIEGYAVLPGRLRSEQPGDLIRQAETLPAVALACDESGRGELFFFGTQLPTPLQGWRAAFYRHLAPIASLWNERLGVVSCYPAELDEFLRCNQGAGQTRPLTHLNRLNQGDYLALHRRDQGEYVFPLQVVALLNEPGKDFHGGEMVMTEQRPRMQSRPMVLPLAAGDVAIITVQRPVKGSKSYYRVNLKHAISRVRGGTRYGMELFFHDGP